MRSSYLVRKELNRIANALESLSYTSILNLFCADNIVNNLDDIEWYLKKIAEKQTDPYIKNGLSNICRNAYAANIRIDEVKEILAKAFPERSEGKKE